MKKLTLNVKKLCKSKNIKMSDLAKKMGITPESLSRSVNGNPQLSTLNEIANALNVDICTLLGSEDDIYGIIVYKNKPYMINSIQELKEFINNF